MIKGREIRITHYDRELLKYRQANLFVKGLTSDETNLTFYNTFKTFGEIFSSRLAQDSQGKSKGYGFVQYKYEEDAKKAIQEMNGKDRLSKKLIVEHYRSKLTQPLTFKNLYVKNFAPSITNKTDLERLFAPFGSINSSAIFQKEYKGIASYYGFVCFADSESAARACEKLNAKEIDGVKLYVTRALSKEQRIRERERRKAENKLQLRRLTLHIKTVNGEPLTESLIHEELAAFGAIKQVSIRTLPDGEKQPVGFVVFTDEEGVQNAIIGYPKGRQLIINQLEGKEERAERIRQIRATRQFDYSAMIAPPFAFPVANTVPAQVLPQFVAMPVRGVRFGVRRGRGRGMVRRPIPLKATDYEIPLYPNEVKAAPVREAKPVAAAQPTPDEKEQIGEQLYEKVEKLSNE